MKVKALTPSIGAEISEIDISKTLSSDEILEIKNAFLKHLVIFFRNQKLTPQSLVRFASSFGRVGRYPFVKGMDACPEVVEVKKNKNEKINFGGLWHTDTSYLLKPPTSSVLYAETIPPIGGDTLFSNMYMAYDGLSESYKKMLGKLKAVNSSEKPDAAVTRTHRIADKPNDAKHITTTASHPIVRKHPLTGKKALFCSNAHTVNIEGMTIEESNTILKFLYKEQQREEYTCRFRWEKGSVAFWDNRASQHNALNDYHGYERVMYRVTHEGETPE